MTFYSLRFVIFFFVLFVIYYAIPVRYRYLWLLVGSYVFYLTWDPKYLIILVSVTLISYLTSLGIRHQNAKFWLILGVSVITLMLIIFRCLDVWPDVSVVAPIGLSFFSLEAIGYMIDTYRRKDDSSVPAGFLKYALFLSFFPCVLSGPIERSNSLLRQIDEGREFDYDRARHGFLMILWGLFMKLLIADRLSMMVDPYFATYEEQTGLTMLVAVVCFGIQLYADFGGYSCIAVGVAETLGFELIKNFKQPYLSGAIGEFWNRWHISLSSWLRDYVYIPLGGNRKGRVRQYVNLLITFAISGLWHGTGLNFLVWGLLHGMYQIAARIGTGFKERVRIPRIIKALWVFILVDFAWLFFRASSLSEACGIIIKILTDFRLSETVSKRLMLMHISTDRFVILIFEIILLLTVDIIHEKNISISGRLLKKHKAVRWSIYLAASFILLIGIIRDFGVDASSFIYARF